ncbi:hypothetical protein LCGC14_2366210 [marine sediment metagenome]|uniref:Uncharacterized protein n=1 Tax=marine sediment metagenome TaxID=412755 RepID=A0A0F9EHM2_9ZZZZ
MEKPMQFALTAPFNLFPDGPTTTLVVGVGLAKYASGKGLAVFLIFKKEKPEDQGGGKQLSVSLPQHAEQLDAAADEFFLKDWADNEQAAVVCVREGLITATGRSPVQAGDRQVMACRIDRSKLRDMTPAELELYKP